MNCCLFSDVLSFNFTFGSNYLLYAQDNILSCAQMQRKTKVEVRLKWKHVYMNLFVWGVEGVWGVGGRKIRRGEWYYISNRMPSTTFCKVSQPISLAQNPGRPCLSHHFYILVKYIHINFV